MKATAEQLGAWIDRWGGPLRAWLRGRCASPDDLVQEAFCRLAQQDSVPERISAWLFQVAMNLSREEHRRGEREARRERAVARPETRSEPIERNLEAEELRQCIERLPEELREVVVARLWGELTLEEIGRFVGASIATVQRRYERALVLLREQLGEKPVRGK